MPYYQQTSIASNTVLRSIRIPTSNDANIYNSEIPVSTSAQAAEEGFYILVTGAAPNQVIGQLTVSFTAEVVPTISAMPLSPTSFSPPGQATMQTVTNLFLAFPQI